jgi:hypothetical protein
MEIVRRRRIAEADFGAGRYSRIIRRGTLHYSAGGDYSRRSRELRRVSEGSIDLLPVRRWTVVQDLGTMSLETLSAANRLIADLDDVSRSIARTRSWASGGDSRRGYESVPLAIT